MLRRLYILRHAKADWPQGMDDKQRPLSAEGRREAQALAAAMHRCGYHPEIALSSPAKRTRETCAIVYDGDNVVYEDKLYLATTGILFERLQEVDDKFNSILLVGHNPGIHGLVQLLVDEGKPAHLTQILAGYRAGCLSVIDCECAVWQDLLPMGHKLADLLVGEELARAG